MRGGIPETPFDVRRQIALESRTLGYRSCQVLAFIRSYIAANGVGPTYDMICDQLMISHRGKVCEIAQRLERRKLVMRPGTPYERIRLP